MMAFLTVIDPLGPLNIFMMGPMMSLLKCVGFWGRKAICL